MRALVVVLAAIGFVVVAGGQAVLPGWLANRIESTVREEFPDADAVEVEVGGFPAYRMLGGEIPHLTIEVAGARLSGLRVARLRIVGEQVEFSNGSSDRLGFRAASGITADAAVTQADLNAYLTETYEAARFLTLRLQAPNIAAFEGAAVILGQAVEARLDGRLQADDGRLLFVPVRAELMGNQVEGAGLEGLADALGWRLDFTDGPLPIAIEAVTVEDDVLHLHGAARPVS